MPGVAGLLSEKDKAPQPHLLLLPQWVCARGVHAQRHSRPGCACMGRPWGLCIARGGAASGWFTPRSEHSARWCERTLDGEWGRSRSQASPPPARTSHPPVLGVCFLPAQPPTLETYAAFRPERHRTPGGRGSQRGQWVPGNFSAGLDPPPQTRRWPGSSPAPPSTARPLWALRLVGKQGAEAWACGEGGAWAEGPGPPQAVASTEDWATNATGVPVGRRGHGNPPLRPLLPQEATPQFWRI